MDHIVIGAGPAGVVAVEHLRKLDPKGAITLIGEEPEPPYSRMAIPYYLIKRIDEAGTYLRKDSGHYSELGIEVVHSRVKSVDTGGRSVALEDGGSRRYDRLLVASGASPVTPPIPGVDLPGVHNCWTLEDARNIIKLMEPGNSVVLVGAGFIGCIILEALAASGVKLTVVETENRMVPRMMNDVAGGMIKDWCAGKGVNVLTSTRVSAIESGSQLTVRFDNGDEIAADMVITATGVAPNTAFLDGSGIKVDTGIVVDEFLQTSVPGVYAAGDCAQGKDFSTGGYSVQAIQPTAVEHGMLAARNMVRGHSHANRGQVNMNVLDTLGLVSSSFGMWMGVDGGDSVERIDHERYRYINLQFQDDCLVGASALGMTDHVGVLRGMIQSETRLGDWKDKLKDDPTRLMEAYLASTQVFG
ncbi:NAD(P)/FAD-dependent oxidoreductase [Pseudomonadota bacterium]